MVVKMEYLGPDELVISDQSALTPSYTAGVNAGQWLREVGRNLVPPAYVLSRLAASSDAELRIAVADHTNAPIEILLMLAGDENPDVRFAVAENHNISRGVLRMLKDDINPYVAHRAEKTLMRLLAGDDMLTQTTRPS